MYRYIDRTVHSHSYDYMFISILLLNWYELFSLVGRVIHRACPPLELSKWRCSADPWHLPQNKVDSVLCYIKWGKIQLGVTSADVPQNRLCVSPLNLKEPLVTCFKFSLNPSKIRIIGFGLNLWKRFSASLPIFISKQVCQVPSRLTNFTTHLLNMYSFHFFYLSG
jgi:hypothetical protein